MKVTLNQELAFDILGLVVEYVDSWGNWRLCNVANIDNRYLS